MYISQSVHNPYRGQIKIFTLTKSQEKGNKSSRIFFSFVVLSERVRFQRSRVRPYWLWSFLFKIFLLVTPSPMAVFSRYIFSRSSKYFVLLIFFLLAYTEQSRPTVQHSDPVLFSYRLREC